MFKTAGAWGSKVKGREYLRYEIARWLNAMHDLAGLANLESTPQLGISGSSAVREPGKSEQVMQEGERMATPFQLHCVHHHVILYARFSQDDCNVEDFQYLSCINGP